MGVTLDTSNINSIADGETIANWFSSKTDAVDPENFREGSNSIGLLKVSSETAWEKFDYYTANSSTYLDFITTPQHIYIWMAVAQAHYVSSVRMTAEDGSGNIGYWNQITAVGQYKGGWKCFVVSSARAFDANNGTDPTMSTIQYLGIELTINSKVNGNVNNVWIDYLHTATGPVIVKGGGVGTEGTLDEVYDALENSSVAAGFLIQQEGSYALQGPLQFGDDGTGDSYFLDENVDIYGADVPVDVDWLTISTKGNSTGTNSFVLGEKSGTVGINGASFKSAGAAKLVFDFSDSNMDTLAVYATKFTDAGTIDWPVAGGTLREALSCSFVGCGEIDPSTMTFKYFQIVSPADRGMTLSSTSHAASDGSIIAAPDGINFDTAGTFPLSNVTFVGCTYDVEFSDTGALILNATGTTDASTYEMTGGGTSVTINNPKTFAFTLTPSITGYEWRLYEVTAIGSLAGAVEKDGEEVATADNQSYQYNYSSDQPIAVQIISDTYVESVTFYTLQNADQSPTIILQVDNND